MDLPEELRRQIVSMLPTSSSDKSGIILSDKKKLSEKYMEEDLQGQQAAWRRSGGGVYKTVEEYRNTAVQILNRPIQVDENLPPNEINEMEEFERDNKASAMEIATAGLFSCDESGVICFGENLKGYSESKVISNAGDDNIIKYLKANPNPEPNVIPTHSAMKNRMPLTYATMNLQDNLFPGDILREQSQFVPPDRIMNKEVHRKSDSSRYSRQARNSFELFPNASEERQNRGSQSRSTDGGHVYSASPGSSRQGRKDHGVGSPARVDRNKGSNNSTKSIAGPASPESRLHKEERISEKRDISVNVKDVANNNEKTTMKRPNWAQKFFDDIQKAIDSGNKDFVRGDFHPCQKKGKRAINGSSKIASSRNDGDRPVLQTHAPIGNENLSFPDDAAHNLRCSEEGGANSGLTEIVLPSDAQETVRTVRHVNGPASELHTSSRSTIIPSTITENSEKHEFEKFCKIDKKQGYLGSGDGSSISERTNDQKFPLIEYPMMEDRVISSKYAEPSSDGSDKLFDGNILRIIMGEKVEEPKPTTGVDRLQPRLEEQKLPTQIFEVSGTAEGEGTHKSEGKILENITESGEEESRGTLVGEELGGTCPQKFDVSGGAENFVDGDTHRPEEKPVVSTSEVARAADTNFDDLNPDTNIQKDSTISTYYSNATSEVPEMENLIKVSTEVEDCDSCEKEAVDKTTSRIEITDVSTELIAFATEFVTNIVKEAQQQVCARFDVNEAVEVEAGTKECVKGMQESPVTGTVAEENITEVREPSPEASAVIDLTYAVVDKVEGSLDQVESPNQCSPGEDVVASPGLGVVGCLSTCSTKSLDGSDDINVGVSAETGKVVPDLHGSVVHTENVTGDVPRSEGVDKTEEICIIDKAESKTDVTMETEAEATETNVAVDVEQLGDPAVIKNAEVSLNTEVATADDLVRIDDDANVSELSEVDDQVDNAAASSISEGVGETESSSGPSEEQNVVTSAKLESQLDKEAAQKCDTVAEITVPVEEKSESSSTEKQGISCAHQ